MLKIHYELLIDKLYLSLLVVVDFYLTNKIDIMLK